MKKSIFIFLLFSCVSFSVLAMNAEITAIKGKVELKQKESWVKAKVGASVGSGTLVSTGFNSEITLKIDGSVIIVQPLTRLTIEDIVKKSDSVASEVFVNVGAIKADIKPKSTKKVEFKVKTPVATASVRGTSGLINADGELFGLSGVWAYQNNAGDEISVAAGSVVTITDQGIIIPAQNTMVANATENNIKTLAEIDKNSIAILPRSKIDENYFIDYKDLLSEYINSEVEINLDWEN